jgi:hypothetical protein
MCLLDDRAMITTGGMIFLSMTDVVADHHAGCLCDLAMMFGAAGASG